MLRGVHLVNVVLYLINALLFFFWAHAPKLGIVALFVAVVATYLALRERDFYWRVKL